MTIIYIILSVLAIDLILRILFQNGFKEYQGFTTRFLDYGDEKISSESIAFWVLLLPVMSIVFYILVVLFFSNHVEYHLLCLITPFFWVFVIIKTFLLNRLDLVNLPFIGSIAILSSIVSFYISNLLFNGNLSLLLPENNNTIWQVYTVVFTFLFSIIQTIYEQDNYGERKSKYILKKYNLYSKKFSIINNLEYDIKSLLIAILIKEDFERPPIKRVFEKIFHCKTRNIAQNNSQNDWHSIYLLIKAVISEVKRLGDIELEENRGQVIYMINNSREYVNDVERLYREVKNIIQDSSINRRYLIENDM